MITVGVVASAGGITLTRVRQTRLVAQHGYNTHQVVTVINLEDCCGEPGQMNMWPAESPSLRCKSCGDADCEFYGRNAHGMAP